MKNFFLSILFIFLLVSCSHKATKTDNGEAIDSLKLKYAEGFSVRNFEHYKEVVVYSPWVKGTEYARYYLVTDAKIKTPTGGVKVKIPLQTMVSTSVTHFEVLSLLGEVETITGVCSPKIIYNPAILISVGEG